MYILDTWILMYILGRCTLAYIVGHVCISVYCLTRVHASMQTLLIAINWIFKWYALHYIILYVGVHTARNSIYFCEYYSVIITSGSRLYNVVTDTEQTSSLLIKHGQLRTRYVMIPLNKIQSNLVFSLYQYFS